MDAADRELLDFLQSPASHEHRRSVYEMLGVPVEEPSVFYLIPLPNLVEVVRSGGIACRNGVQNRRVDLSSPEVQGKREHALSLKGDPWFRRTVVHDCVNLFWNPLNLTLYAFRRNALFAAHSTPNQVDEDVTVVCILRIPLAALLKSDDWKWALTGANAAGAGGGSTWDAGSYASDAWPWQQVYNGNRFTENRLRSAEILLHRGDATASAPVPVVAVAEILVEFGAGPRARAAIPEFSRQIREVAHDEVFAAREELLPYEVKGFGSLWAWERNTKRDVSALGAILHAFPEVAGDVAGPMNVDRFERERVAIGLHGVAHVTRVMFWTFLLTVMSGFEEEVIRACLLAGALHDLCRVNNDDEPEHGTLAAEKFEGEIRERVGGTLTQDVLDAIEYHSRPDGEYARRDNLVWQVLKDADALDRGRFGTPVTPAKEKTADSNGCRTGMLRLPMLQDERVATEFAWMAWRFVKLSQYASWDRDGNSYPVLVDRVLAGARAAMPFVDVGNDRQRIVRLIAAIEGRI